MSLDSGQIRLAEPVLLPEKTRVLVVLPDTEVERKRAEQPPFPGRQISYREGRRLALAAMATAEERWDKAAEEEAEFFENGLGLGPENGADPR